MRWIVEVGHVLLKDVRRARWSLLAYSLVIALATMRAIGVLPTFAPLNQLSEPLIVLFATLLAAMTVQGDSPTRSDAFWTAHPFRPSAVLGAKVAFALVVIAMAAAGQLVALRQYNVDVLEVLSLTLVSAAALGEWMLPAMILAALTRDLRTFLVTVILATIGTSFVLSLVDAMADLRNSMPGTAAPESPVWFSLVGSALGLAALIWLYRARDARAGTKVGAGAAGVAAFILFTVTVRGAEAGEFAASPPPEGAVRLVEGSLRISGSQLSMEAVLEGRDRGAHALLADPTLVVRLRDGARLRLPSAGGSGPIADPPILTELPEAGARSLSRRPRAARRTRVAADLDPEQRRAVDTGVESVALEGRLISLVRRDLVTLPLEPGREWTSNGTRVRIESWSHEYGQPVLRLHASMLYTGSRRAIYYGWPWYTSVIHPLIVNDTESEVITIERRRNVEDVDGLMLPGPPTTGLTAEYSYATGDPRAEQPPSDEWFAGAKLRLVVFEIRSQHKIRLEMAAAP